jgi:hypothetical protein
MQKDTVEIRQASRNLTALFCAVLALAVAAGCHRPGGPEQPPARPTPTPAAEPTQIDLASLIKSICPALAEKPEMFEATLRTCGAYEDKAQALLCVGLICRGLKTPAPPATATSTSTATPRATAAPTSSPTPVATASPTIPPWQVRLKFYEGFHGCNPAPCNTLDNVTVAKVDPDGKTHTCAELYPARSRCDGDRTPMCEMPGFDYPGLEKGTGCRELSYCLTQPIPTDVGKCIDNCLAHDSPGTPCGGAAACDPDHMGCPRTFVGCQGKNRGDVRGSKLSWTGLKSCTEAPNHYGFTCTGTPGVRYEICTEPLPGATNEDGSPLLGGSKRCKNGWF